MKIHILIGAILIGWAVWSCDDNGGGTEADRIGIGAECGGNDDCLQPDNPEEPVQVCLTQFKGGYCGLEKCTSNEDCPIGGVCVAHDDGTNYCFRACVDKAECNINRGPDVESNCSANITFVDPSTTGKACVPPSG